MPAPKGQVYSDAVDAMREWQRAGLLLYIYSSGSAEARKLRFAHSEHGDLFGLFSGYFDLAVGGKEDAGMQSVGMVRQGHLPTEVPYKLARDFSFIDRTISQNRLSRPGLYTG
ncbi:MAG: hypothetical protein KQH53_18570 [Desulfarculaceae bacterium]|nr:hypothetical protein [Desulfarculaceae bacterium]